jgi:hypothetical protein
MFSTTCPDHDNFLQPGIMVEFDFKAKPSDADFAIIAIEEISLDAADALTFSTINDD